LRAPEAPPLPPFAPWPGAGAPSRGVSAWRGPPSPPAPCVCRPCFCSHSQSTVNKIAILPHLPSMQRLLCHTHTHTRAGTENKMMKMRVRFSPICVACGSTIRANTHKRTASSNGHSQPLVCLKKKSGEVDSSFLFWCVTHTESCDFSCQLSLTFPRG
jgi:hypothetical protein